MSDLKPLPCPFCGGINIINCGLHKYCHSCGAEGPDADNGTDAGMLSAWNRRAQPAQAGQVLTDDEVALIVAELAASAHRQDDFSFARAIEQAVMAKRVPQWLPIETAPRGSGEDGPSNTTDPDYIEPPHLLLWTQEGIRVGYYDWYYHPGYGRGADPNEPAWRGADGERLYGPTHWMPLPPPPRIVGEKGGV